MNRRDLLKAMLALPLLPAVLPRGLVAAWAAPVPTLRRRNRVRPGDPAWPTAAQWSELKQDVGGRLLSLESPFAQCHASPASASCTEAMRHLKNPYYLGDQPALTQTSG
jgi:hypothetical protein